jgi:hypothetical protein
VAGEQLEQHHARGVDVAARIERLAPRLLGRHVLGRPHQHVDVDDRRVLGSGARQRQRRHGHGRELGDAEVTDLDHVGGVSVVAGGAQQEHVFRLEIAVDHAEAVGLRQRAEDLAHDVDHALLAEREFVVEQLQQVGTLDELHDDVEQVAALGAEIEHAHRVRMIEPRRRLRFALEQLDHLRAASQLEVEDLQRDRLLEHAVPGAVHRARRPAPDVLLEVVLAPDHAPGELGAIRTSLGACFVDFAHVRPDPQRCEQSVRRCTACPAAQPPDSMSPEQRTHGSDVRPSGRQFRLIPVWELFRRFGRVEAPAGARARSEPVARGRAQLGVGTSPRRR